MVNRGWKLCHAAFTRFHNKHKWTDRLSFNNGYALGFEQAMRDQHNGVPLKLKGKSTKGKQWVDGGYLGNGHCSFMYGGFRGACCCLSHGHKGPHLTDSQSSGGADGG